MKISRLFSTQTLLACLIVLHTAFSLAEDTSNLNFSPLPDHTWEKFTYPSCWFNTEDSQTLIFIRSGEEMRDDIAVLNLNGTILELPYLRTRHINNKTYSEVFQKESYTLYATITDTAKPTLGKEECTECPESSGVIGNFKFTNGKASKTYKFTGACGI